MEWDWIGPDSPLMSGLSESAWLLERLCESLVRLAKKPYAAGGREVAKGIAEGEMEGDQRAIRWAQEVDGGALGRARERGTGDEGVT